MIEIKNRNVQKLIKQSAYIAILNKLTKEHKITSNEYEKIKNKINKKCWEMRIYIEKEIFLIYNNTCNRQEGGKMAEVQII